MDAVYAIPMVVDANPALDPSWICRTNPAESPALFSAGTVSALAGAAAGEDSRITTEWQPWQKLRSTNSTNKSLR
jgi:hypothetical protein